MEGDPTGMVVVPKNGRGCRCQPSLLAGVAMQARINVLPFQSLESADLLPLIQLFFAIGVLAG